MSQATLQKREQRAKLVADAQKINDLAVSEKRSMTAEETVTFDKHMDDVDKLKGEIDSEEGEEKRSQRLAAAKTGLDASAGRTVAAATPSQVTAVAKWQKKYEARKQKFGEGYAKRGLPEYNKAFGKWLARGEKGCGEQERRSIQEVRALQADADVVGGYLIPPVQFVNKLILFLKDLVFIRQLATVIPVNAAQSLGVPSLDADPSDAIWTSELATGAEDNTMAFGRRDLSPHPLAKRIKLSNKMLRLAPDAEALVMDRLAYKFAITEEKAFLTGTGAQQPLGVFTATGMGIDTSRDVSTGNTTGSVTVDGLMEAKYTLKAQYQQNKATSWLFHRTTVKMIRKLKDANGQYIWSPGLGGEPDMILEKPFYMSEYVPNTYTTGLYVGIIGDWNFYWIADALNMAMQRLDELYAETNQTGFIARRELDAMPVLAEAFVRVKLA